MIAFLRHVTVNAVAVIFFSWLSILIIARIYDFHVSYIKFLNQIESETWLRVQCESDEFYHNMAFHTDVCESVRANGQISPALYALNHSLSNMKLCGLYACSEVITLIWTGGFPVLFCFALVYICTPSFLFPLARSTYERHRDASFVRKCSPMLKYHPLDSTHVKNV